MEFDWDTGNTGKNLKHGVSDEEAEQIFLDPTSITFFDKGHSRHEQRFFVVGVTQANRKLYVAFTVRESKIRVISARDLNKKEFPLYEKAS